MAEFRMPSLGADMEAGTLVRWHVHPGDVVRRGDVVATIETDKAAIEVEIWEGGTIEALLVTEGTRVPVGTPLATLTSSASSEVAAPAAPPPESPAAPEPTPVAPPASVATPPPSSAPPLTPPSGVRGRVTPLARVTAQRLGVDPATLEGTGFHGAVTRGDVERAAEAASAGPVAPRAPEQAPPEGAPDRATSMRRAIAAAMSRSHREIPHYYLASTIDLESTLAWLERTNRERPVAERVLPIALYVRAVALAVADVPELNGYWLDDAFRPGARVNVGSAVAIPGGGLIAPAILDVDRKPLGVVMTELRNLVARARAGSLRSSELSDATITVTSLGERGGVDAVFGLINPPQVALVGFGAILERPWAERGMLDVRRQVTVSLAGDHRASDGHRGALFLASIERRLQHPEEL